MDNLFTNYSIRININMKLYIIKYEKNNEEYKKVVLKMSNDLAGEEVFYSGFLRELEEEKD